MDTSGGAFSSSMKSKPLRVCLPRGEGANLKLICRKNFRRKGKATVESSILVFAYLGLLIPGTAGQRVLLGCLRVSQSCCLLD